MIQRISRLTFQTLLLVIIAAGILFSIHFPVSAEDFNTQTELPEAENGVIKLTSDVKMPKGRYITESVTIDLNGYRLSATQGETLYLTTGVVVTIIDSSPEGTGKLSNYDTSNNYYCVRIDGGTLNMESGSIEDCHYGAIFLDGTFNMKGGTITDDIDAYRGTVTITGGTITDEIRAACIVNFSGGNVDEIIMREGTINLSGNPVFTNQSQQLILRKFRGQYQIPNIVVTGKLTGIQPIGITYCDELSSQPNYSYYFQDPDLTSLPKLIATGMKGNATLDNFKCVQHANRYKFELGEDGNLYLVPKPDATITYHKNDGAETEDTSTQTAYVTIEENNPFPTDLATNEFTRDYYTFSGWNTKADGSGTDYKDKETIILKDDLDLYAIWDPIPYNITYDLAGGDISSGQSNPDTYTTEDTITLINPEKEDYDFIGWTGDELNQETLEVTIPKGSNGDKKYTANWKIKEYTVSFNTNGGSKVASQKVVIHQKATNPSKPKRSNYTFVGWYTDKAGTQTYDFQKEITKDITLYARWTPNPVPVIMAQGKSSGKRAVKLSWSKVPGAVKYKVYGGKCGQKVKLTKTTRKTSCLVKKIKGKKLKAHSFYKFYVVALNSSGKVVASSKGLHIITAKSTKKYANIKSIKAKKKQIVLLTGEETDVEATVTLPKGKKHISSGHGPFFRYTSDNPKVASVDRYGAVTAMSYGKAIIYIQDTCGMYCSTMVTVK